MATLEPPKGIASLLPRLVYNWLYRVWLAVTSLETNSNPNWIINGNFDRWDYGATQTSNGYGSANRWRWDSNGSSHSVTRQAFTVGQTDVHGNPKYYARTVVTSSAGVSNYSVMSQRVEHVSTLSGGKACAAIWAKADASRSVAIELVQVFGTGGSPSGTVYISPVTLTLTTQWQLFLAVFDVASISGKTLGTNNNDYLQAIIWFDAGVNYDSRSGALGQQSGTFDIAQVKLEDGERFTVFNDVHPLGYREERYLYRVTPNFPYSPIGNGYWSGSTTAVVLMEMPEELRNSVSFIYEGSLSNFFITTGGGLGGGAINGITLAQYSEKTLQLNVNYTAGGQTAGVGTILRTNNQTTYSVYAESEL